MTAAERLTELLREGDITATNLELAEGLDVSLVTVDNVLRKLENSGKLIRYRIGRRRRITVAP